MAWLEIGKWPVVDSHDNWAAAWEHSSWRSVKNRQYKRPSNAGRDQWKRAGFVEMCWLWWMLVGKRAAHIMMEQKL